MKWQTRALWSAFLFARVSSESTPVRLNKLHSILASLEHPACVQSVEN
jgi:hypothetical protein